MTGIPTAVIPQDQTSTKRISFYQFLANYVSPSPLGDPIADLAADVRRDPRAPRANCRLLDYLLRRDIPGDVVEEAEIAWKLAAAAAREERRNHE